LNFDMLSEDLLAIFMLWFCLPHVNVHSVCAAAFRC